jgi:hypothetical protein
LKYGAVFATIVRVNELVVDKEPSLAVTLTDCVPASPSCGVKVKVLVAELNVIKLACVPVGLKVIVTSWPSGSVAPIVYVNDRPSITLLDTSAGLNVGA